MAELAKWWVDKTPELMDETIGNGDRTPKLHIKDHMYYVQSDPQGFPGPVSHMIHEQLPRGKKWQLLGLNQ